jgi:hypothetical protein
MSHFARTPGVFPLAVLLASTLALVAALAGDRLEQPPEVSPEEAIERALETKVSLKFAGTPLADVVEQLSKSQKIPILLSRRDLENAGIDAATPIDFECREMTLGSALYHMLRPFELVVDSKEGALAITTHERACEAQKVRLYYVKDLLFVDDEGKEDYDSLIDLIKSTVSPTSWDDVGGPGSIAPYSGMLVFAQTDAVHREVRDLLAALRKVAGQHKEGGTVPAWVLPATHEQVLGDVEKRLDQVTRLKIGEQPLSEVIKGLAKSEGLNIHIDSKGLEDAGIPLDTPLSLDVVNLQVKTALEHALGQTGLTFTFDHEALIVTTRERSSQTPLTRIYPVGDLVTQAPADEFEDPSDDYDTLIGLIKGALQPTSWDDVGGHGSIGKHERTKSLVCSTDRSVHHEIEKLLATIRRMRPKPAEIQPAAADRRVVRVYMLAEKNGIPTADGGEVAKLLTETVEPEAWKQPDAYIRPIAGRLMVRQTPAVHRKVKRLLDKLDLTASAGGGGFGGGKSGAAAADGEKKPSGGGFF